MIIDDDVEVSDMTEKQTQPKVLLSFPYKSTGMGGFEDVIILSFRTKKPVKSVLRKSGTHGTRYYRLLPARYLLYKVWRSNSGNLHCNVMIIRVMEGGKTEVEKDWRIVDTSKQELQLEDLPAEVQEVLVANKQELPLFGYVFLLEKEDISASTPQD